MNNISITDWILEATLAGSLLVIIIMLVKKALGKKLSVTAHYYIWLLLIIKLIMPFGPESKISIYNVINPSYISNAYENTYKKTPEALINNGDEIYSDKTTNNNLEFKSIERKDTTPTQNISYIKIDYKKIFIIIWVVGAALAFAHTIAGLIKIKKIILSSAKDNEKVNSILEEAKRIVDIKQKIQLGFTDQISSPSLFGILNPIIIIPNIIAMNLTEKELKYVFIHELCHIKRKDIIISWLRAIFKTIHWFNPLIVFGLSTMEKDCEMFCDNTVLSYLDNSENKAYGNTIINVLQLVNRPMWLPGGTPIIMKKNDLKRRIKMISNYGKISIGSIFIGIVIILIVATVGLTNKIAKIDASNSALNNASSEAKKNINVMSTKSLSITLTDNMDEINKLKGNSFFTNSCPYIVSADDIKSITNELKNLNAVKISVNGEQISDSSEISAVAQFIKINGNKYKSPFVIKAIWNKNIPLDSLLKDNSDVNKLKSRGIGVKIGESIDSRETQVLETDKPVEVYKNSGIILNLHRNDKTSTVFAGKREMNSLIKLLSLDTTKEIYINDQLITNKTVFEDTPEPGYILVDGRKVSTKETISIKAVGNKDELFNKLSFPGNLQSEEKFKFYDINYKVFGDNGNITKDIN
ncbi:M56 family metallopeptidase [Candidatus Clostridium stratigraminis]|uniref:M56 family metallopeptidase n=1 Tax=Candidatus Clostridium stratigraminis TaxID=3381661 RepID=A0ABW8T142_9CLOT